MKNKNIRMNNRKSFLESTSLIKTVLFLLLGICINMNVNAQSSISVGSIPASNTFTADGKAYVVVSGIPGGMFSYTWTNASTGVQASQINTTDFVDTLTDFSGTYEIAVTNFDFSFSATDTVTITAPGASFTYVGSFILCGGAANTFITAFNQGCTFLGQTLGTNYVLSDATGTTYLDTIASTTAMPLPALGIGTYYLSSLNLDNGCTGFDTFNITANQLNVTTYSTNVLNNTLGLFTITASGATSPYTLTWQGQSVPTWSNGDTLFGLPTGVYNYTVTSSDGCDYTDSVLIENTCDGQITSTNYDSCASEVFVSASINMIGTGSYNFDYELSDGSSVVAFENSTLSNITFSNGVGSGTFYLNITETNSGCIVTDTIVHTLNPISVSSSINLVTSPGACDGGVFVTPITGQFPYTFEWSNSTGIFSTNNGPFSQLTNLCDDTYCVTITDANGCTFTECYDVLYYPCDVTLSIYDSVDCFNGFGAIQVTIDTTGNPGGPYQYNLFNANNGNQIGTTQINVNTQFVFPNLPAGNYFVNVFDPNFGSFCNPDTITLTEPDQIQIWTSVDSSSSPCAEDGMITIDSITGGTAPFTVTWLDSVLSPLPVGVDTNLLGNAFQDSLGYSNINDGGYLVLVTDANGCSRNLTVYLHPQNSGDDFAIESWVVTQPKCYGVCDASILATMAGMPNGCLSVPPFTFYWIDGATGGAGQVNDTLKVDSVGTPFYNPSHVATYTNLCPGTYQLHAYDYYGNFGGIENFTITEPDSISLGLADSLELFCGEDQWVFANATGGPTVNDTTLHSSNTLDFGNQSGFQDSLNINDYYILEVSGVYEDTAGNLYDAAWDYSLFPGAPATPIMHWDFDGNNTHRPFPDAYNLNHVYQFPFVSATGVHNFAMTLPGFLQPGATGMQFDIYLVRYDTTMFTYSWEYLNNTGTANIGNLDSSLVYPYYSSNYEPTDYIVTVTDATGSCNKSDQIHVTWDLGILNFDTIGISQVSCYGDSSSTIILAIDTTSSGTNTPGFAPYIFYLDGNSTLGLSPTLYSDTINNIPAGLHTVSISDSLGCISREIDVEVIQSDSLYACGMDTNLIEVFVESFAMTFQDTFEFTTVNTALLGMNYRLKVSGTYNDSWSGSNYKDAAYKYNTTPPISNIDWFMNLSNNFNPTPNQYNASHEYTFEFVGDGSPIDFLYTDLFDTIYANNTGTLNFELFKLVCPSVDTTYTCYGDSTASASVFPTGGTPFDPDGFANSGDEFYDIVWKNFANITVGTGSTLNNLSQGQFFAQITDALGCQYLRSLVVIQSPAPLSIDSISTSAVACRHDSSGGVYAIVSGGFTSQIAVLMSGNDTLWVEQGLLDTLLIGGLLAGTYDLFIYDTIPNGLYGTYGCPVIEQVVITEPQDTLSTAVNLLTDVQCWGDSTGAAIANAIGGQFPYTYQWEAGNTSALVSNLWAGWQVVEISDFNGCVKLDSIEIVHLYSEISGNLDVIQDVSCFGGCDAIASLSTIGGVLPHTYFWDIGQVSINMPDTAFNLCYGGHDIIVEDALGCRQTVTFNISQPDELFAQAVMTQPVQCYGFNDGTAFASATGGTQFYSFVWDSINGQAGQNATNLTPGVHVIYVTDAKGCTAQDTVNISEPELLTIEIVDTMTVYSYCSGTNSGQLCAIADGGTPNYNYVWNDALGQTGTCAFNLTANQYTVLVMDERNCIATVSYNLDSITNSMDPDSVTMTINDVKCFGAFDGSVTINNIVGAVAPYTYSWTGPNSYNSTLSSISSLYAGSYAVAIEDSNGCAITVNAEVMQPDQLEYTTYNVEGATCLGACNGEIHIDVEGGTWPYYYDVDEQGSFPLFNTVQLINDTIIDNLCAGLHSIYITDGNNCEGTVVWGGRWEETVDQGVLVNIDSVVALPATCFNLNDGVAYIRGGGNPLFTYTFETNNPGPPAGPSGISLNNNSVDSLDNFYPGTYWAVAHYADSNSFGVPYSGCDFAYQFNIGSSAQLITSATVPQEVSCYGDTDGEINLIISGGTAPYSVQWDTTTSLPNGSNSLLINSLQPGTYTANITDDNGCTITSDFVITEPSAITNSYTITEPLCFGGSNGSAVSNTNGGNPPYSYNPNIFSPGTLQAGVYAVVITDSKGCTFLDEATVTQPDPVISSVESDNLFFGPFDVRCNGESNASATVTAGGGVSLVSYLWTPSNQNTATATNLSAGSYDVTATDLNNCSQTETIIITEPNQLIVNLTRSGDTPPFYDISCFGLNDGWAQSIPTGGVEGTTGYDYQWISGSNNISSNYYIDNLEAGLIYSVIVTDANGCEETDATPVLTEPIEFIANVISLDYAGPTHEGFTVNFEDLTVCSDAYNFVWSWVDGTQDYSAGTTNFDHMFDVIGLNEIFVTLENEVTLCTDTVGFKIEVQGIPEIYNVFSPNGDGVNDMFGFGEYAMEDMNVEFFNRWGELVYTWDLSYQQWDGRGLDGRDLPEGVYFFVLQSTGLDGRYYEKRGSVTILR